MSWIQRRSRAIAPAALVAAAEAHPLGSLENPVRVGGPDGERAYLARLRCTNGSAGLVPHRLRRRLLCHHCGYGRSELEHCPECGTVDALTACGPGVERLAVLLTRHASRRAVVHSQRATACGSPTVSAFRTRASQAVCTTSSDCSLSRPIKGGVRHMELVRVRVRTHILDE